MLNAEKEWFKQTAGIPCTKPCWNEWEESQLFLGIPRVHVHKAWCSLADEDNSGCLGWNWMRLVILCQGAVRITHEPHIRPYLSPFWAEAELFLQTLTHGSISAKGLTLWSTQWDFQGYCCPDFKYKGPQSQLETRFLKLLCLCSLIPIAVSIPAQRLLDTAHWTTALPAIRIPTCLCFLARLSWGWKGRADVSMRNR